MERGRNVTERSDVRAVGERFKSERGIEARRPPTLRSQGKVRQGSDCNARRADYKLADKYDDGGDD